MANILPNLENADIDAIVSQVQTELALLAKNEKDRASQVAGKPLKKADGDDAPPSKDESASDDASSGPPAGGESSGPPAEASAPPAGGDASAGAPGADPAAAGGDPAAQQGPVDPAALQAEYAKLPLDQLKMHVEVASAALAAAMGGGDPSAMGAPPPPAAGPAAGAPPPPAGPADASAPPMGKAEMKPQGNGGDIKLAKAEQEIAQLKAQLAETQELANGVASTFKAFVSKPLRKAETGLTPAAPAPVKLSKSEVKAKLEAKIPDRSLTKNDRELINKVLCNEPVTDAQIAHLLK